MRKGERIKADIKGPTHKASGPSSPPDPGEGRHSHMENYYLNSFLASLPLPLCALTSSNLRFARRYDEAIQTSSRLRQACHPYGGKRVSMGSMADGAIFCLFYLFISNLPDSKRQQTTTVDNKRLFDGLILTRFASLRHNSN